MCVRALVSCNLLHTLVSNLLSHACKIRALQTAVCGLACGVLAPCFDICELRCIVYAFKLRARFSKNPALNTLCQFVWTSRTDLREGRSMYSNLDPLAHEVALAFVKASKASCQTISDSSDRHLASAVAESLAHQQTMNREQLSSADPSRQVSSLSGHGLAASPKRPNASTHERRTSTSGSCRRCGHRQSPVPPCSTAHCPSSHLPAQESPWGPCCTSTESHRCELTSTCRASKLERTNANCPQARLQRCTWAGLGAAAITFQQPKHSQGTGHATGGQQQQRVVPRWFPAAPWPYDFSRPHTDTRTRTHMGVEKNSEATLCRLLFLRPWPERGGA